MFFRTFLTSFSRSLRALCSSSKDFFIFLLSCKVSRRQQAHCSASKGPEVARVEGTSQQSRAMDVHQGMPGSLPLTLINKTT